MLVRQIVEKDMPEIYGWMRERKWPYPPIDRIAPEWGFVAEEDGVMYACAFSYVTGSSIAFIDWTATNPNLEESKTVKALVEVVNKLKDIFQNITPPVKAMALFTQNERLAERFEKSGFRKQEKYFRCLWVGKQ
jgi:hypothetical protein